jgi:hypothetical protein
MCVVAGNDIIKAAIRSCYFYCVANEKLMSNSDICEFRQKYFGVLRREETIKSKHKEKTSLPSWTHLNWSLKMTKTWLSNK